MWFLIQLIQRLLKAPISDSLIGTAIRHGATVLGALLVGWGVDQELVGPFLDITIQFAVGVVTIALSLALSYLNKKR